MCYSVKFSVRLAVKVAKCGRRMFMIGNLPRGVASKTFWRCLGNEGEEGKRLTSLRRLGLDVPSILETDIDDRPINQYSSSLDS